MREGKERVGYYLYVLRKEKERKRERKMSHEYNSFLNVYPEPRTKLPGESSSRCSSINNVCLLRVSGNGEDTFADSVLLMRLVYLYSV